MPKENDALPDRRQLLLVRHSQMRAAMRKADIPAVLELDSSHIVYATGARNMQLFTLRTPARYLLILADGPAILYEYVGCEHLAKDLETIDDIRLSEGLDTISSGGDLAGSARRFAAAIAGAIRDHDPEIDRIAFGRFPWRAVDALRAEGFSVTDADAAWLPARAIKLDIELPFIREAMRRVEEGVRRLEDAAAPDRTEAETWAEFYYSLMAKEGQYVSTRLFQSGSNTFPYFQEAGSRVLKAGDLLCLDTDAVGFENYAVDFSRTFLCGQDKASNDQRLLMGGHASNWKPTPICCNPDAASKKSRARRGRFRKNTWQADTIASGTGLECLANFPIFPIMWKAGPIRSAASLNPG